MSLRVLGLLTAREKDRIYDCAHSRSLRCTRVASHYFIFGMLGPIANHGEQSSEMRILRTSSHKKRSQFGFFFYRRSTRVWNPCVVITVPFPKRASRVILPKTGQMGHYKKGVSCFFELPTTNFSCPNQGYSHNLHIMCYNRVYESFNTKRPDRSHFS